MENAITPIEKPISLKEAREFLNNVSRQTFRKWIEEGKIRRYGKHKRQYFFKSQLVEDLKNL